MISLIVVIFVTVIFMHFDIIPCLQLLYLFCKTLVNCHAYNESECVMPSWHNWQKTTSPDQQNPPYWSIPDSFTVSRQQPELNYCELVVLLSHRHLLDIYPGRHLILACATIKIYRATELATVLNHNLIWTTACFEWQFQPCFLVERCF